ncbi:MAG: hotdog fold domain-containing protein [Firmicutes bacterium]|nr:hotdog fold domain-containing protein [Bacillota bacterium]
MIRVRMSDADAHYAGRLVDGAKMLQLFGDVATELLIRNDGDEGLFVAYEEVVFVAPVFAGDYIEALGRIVHVGNRSRKMEFVAYKVVRGGTDPDVPSRAQVVEPPELVTRAVGTCAIPKAL